MKDKEIKKEIKELSNVRGLKVLNAILIIIRNLTYSLIAIAIGELVANISKDAKLTDYFIVLGIVFVVALVFGFINPWLLEYTQTKARKNVNVNVLKKVTNKELAFFKEKDLGEVINYVDTISGRLSDYLVVFPLDIVDVSSLFLSVIPIIFVYNWLIGIIVLVLFFGMGALYKPVLKLLGEGQAEYFKGRSFYQNEINQLFSNIETVKMINNKNYIEKNFMNSYDKYTYQVTLKVAKYQGYFWGLNEITRYVLPLLVLFIGLLMSSYNLVALGVIIAIYNLVLKLPSKVQVFYGLFSDYISSKKYTSELEPLFTVNSVKEEVTDFKLLEFKSKGISFDKKTILENVNFNLLPNDFISIVGESGKGKSTIFKYLLGIEENDNIKVTVDNKNISNLDLSKLILMVNQKPLLFKDTLINNILCGSNFKEEEIKEVIDTCLLSEFVKNYGYDKLFDNLDSNISGGEKQRVALARILIRKPKILLLDEITASLDEKSSNDLALNIYNYTRKYNISVAVISHKDEFTKYANKIIKI